MSILRDHRIGRKRRKLREKHQGRECEVNIPGTGSLGEVAVGAF